MNLLMYPKFLLVAFATTTIASTTEATGVSTSFAIARSFTSNIDSVHEKRENVHRLLTAIQGVQGDTGGKLTTPAFKKSRHLDYDDRCDTQFMSCLPNNACMDCFEQLAIQEIDWAGVTVATTCSDVVKFLTADGHCTSLDGDAVGTTTFCDTFDACVIFDDEETETDDGDFLDCDTLTKCAWDGMHQGWVGDGVCHDNMYGCYNTAVCGYDGGDCCEDTCEISTFSSYVECGHDGYACRDPISDNCNSALTTNCPNNANGGSPEASDVKCEEGETKYRLVMYDSFGDGWDKTTLTIQVDGRRTNIPADVIFKGGLVEGFEGTEYICLSKGPLCYNAKTQGGTWGVEVSWDIRPLSPGSPSIAGGGAPGNCDFSLAGEVCPNTCEDTKPNVAPDDDPDYINLKELYDCIEKKCVVQLGACQDDAECDKCFSKDEEPGSYCYGIDAFMAVVDCTLCSCTDNTEREYCTGKSGPGQVIPPTPKGGDKNIVKQCTPRETIDGTSAIMDYSSCSNLDSVSLLITEFDQNNFGQLDSFEMCAHQFKDGANQRTALSCMQILKDTITNPTTDKNAPGEAISALAKDLYDNAGDFCDCTKKASDACPLCPSFMNFKTILYESIDACESLDAIDCDAWNEFWEPCSDKLKTEYPNWSDFTNPLVCEFVKDGCGSSVGPFPAFRRLDCEEEVPEEAWTFYKQFAKGCLRGADGIAPTAPPRPTTPTTPAPKPVPDKPKPTPAPNPAPVPVPTPTDPGDKPTAKPYIPTDDDNSTPYVPSSDDEEKKESKSHWFRNTFVFSVLAGLGYYVYKKRFDGFNFMQYRRRTFGRGAGFDYGMVSSSGVGENEMYGNLNSSTTFEPPTLPPTPQMMVNGPYNAP